MEEPPEDWHPDHAGRDPQGARFKKAIVLVTVLHVLFLVVFAIVSLVGKKKPPEDVMWLDAQALAHP